MLAIYDVEFNLMEDMELKLRIDKFEISYRLTWMVWRNISANLVIFIPISLGKVLKV